MRAFTVQLSQLDACPIRSWTASHHRADGTCKCDGDPGLCRHCAQPTILVNVGRASERGVHLHSHERHCHPQTSAEL